MNNKHVCSGLLSLLLLSACSTSNIWESITGEREVQVINGGRRMPELNATPAATPQSYVAPVFAPQAAVTSPYDNYDVSGNALDMNSNNSVAEVSPENATQTPKTGNYFTRLIGWDNAPKAQAEPLANPPSNSIRKSFSGNQYFQLDQNTTSAEPQKLSSVPATPTQFQDVKSSLQNDMNQLQSDHAVATQAKTELDNEIATGATTGAAPATEPSDTIKPLLPLQENKVSAESAPIPVDSLPEIKVDAQAQDVATSTEQSQVAAPQNQPIPVEATPSQLPSPEIIKTMRPSRYESRNQQLQNPSN